MHYRDLKPGERVFLNPPNVHVMLTGAMSAVQRKSGEIILTYTDGSTESRKVKSAPNLADMDLFAAVSFVQAGRKAA